MVRIAVIGGRLQGLEALFLAKEAGYRTLLIDRKQNPLARNLADDFLCRDVSDLCDDTIEALKKFDLIIPAFEDYEVLAKLDNTAGQCGLPLMADMRAYAVSSSKKASDVFFRNHSLPIPERYPGGCFPYIGKIPVSSGSRGICYIADKHMLDKYINEVDGIVQEFIEGRQFSAEVIGTPGNYTVYEITELFVDDGFDCKAVECPANLPDVKKAEISGIALKTAEKLGLSGIMDIEFILSPKGFVILEIDARFPSQTPVCVYHATGVNYVTELLNLWKGVKPEHRKPIKHSRLEHYKIENGVIHALGEHIVAECEQINVYKNCMGVDFCFTDYKEDKRSWAVTLVYGAESAAALACKHRRAQLGFFIP
ncbi:MAG: 3-methylornithine--L-lysine ligase PylC [Defluviitaleaceae bacterium]|nr:3-methylornithine--L-lysine ligase PylC [Defluviitaleaceae bacterium]MCL2836633.1 3-methylornithine--L-lysine ligase PylC [Defluviitaleaceae bacterium]